MSERQHKILVALFDLAEGRDEGSCFYTRTIAPDAKLTQVECRVGLRALVRQGLVEYHRGLFDDDAMAAGSGYCISPEGEKIIASERAKEEHEREMKEAQTALPL